MTVCKIIRGRSSNIESETDRIMKEIDKIKIAEE
jgi:hypothetical protein